MKKLLVYLVVFGLVTLGLGLSMQEALDLPTMHKSHLTKECVKVVTPDGEKTCDFIKAGDKHHVVWVADF